MLFFFLLLSHNTKANHVTISTHQFSDLIVMVASDSQSRTKGLMNVKKLINSNGMLFLFDKPQIVNMWMYKTYLNLDMIFIDKKKKVISIKETVPLSKEIISSERKVIAVLELPKDCYKRLKINIGDRIDWSEIKYPKNKTYRCLYN